MSLVEAPEVCAARSSFSHSRTRAPRPARSRAMPEPLMPPPTTSTSTSRRAAVGVLSAAVVGIATILASAPRRHPELAKHPGGGKEIPHSVEDDKTMPAPAHLLALDQG